MQRPMISAAPLGIHIVISASPLINVSKCGAYWNSYYIRLVAKWKNAYGSNMQTTKQ